MQSAPCFYNQHDKCALTHCSCDCHADKELYEQARKDPILRRVLEQCNEYPKGGTTERRILRRALLEFSRQLILVQRVAMQSLQCSSMTDFGKLVDDVKKELGYE
jgi:hypothetical protein